MITGIDENQETHHAEAAPQSKGLTMRLAVGVLVALLVGGGVFLIFQHKEGISQLFFKSEVSKEKEFNILDVGYLTLPDVIINLKSTKNHANVLKATFVLELESINDKEAIDRLKPVIMDEFQTYLRELELADIQGSSGLERIRQELFTRVNNGIAPLKIRKILIKEFLTQ
jgi:flagellar FliL protein